MAYSENFLVAAAVFGWLFGMLCGYFIRDRLAVGERWKTAEEHRSLVDKLIAKTPEQYQAWKAVELQARRAEAEPPPPPPPPPPPWELHPDYQGKVTILGDQVVITDDEGSTTGGIASVRRVPVRQWYDQWGYKP